MDDQHDSQQPAPRGGKVLDALTRAERQTVTRPAPNLAKAQVKLLLTRMKDSTKDLTERLGCSTRTVQRYRAGQLKKPQKRLQTALVEETASEWQPQVRAQARKRAATSSGLMVNVHAYFGFACKGSSETGANGSSAPRSRPATPRSSSVSRRRVRRRRICIRSSRRPSPSRISRNGAPGRMTSGRISRTSDR